MALIKCPDCSKEVSSNAPACPNCGSPISATTIEQTSKKWKKMKLIAWVFAIGGFIIMFNSEGNTSTILVGILSIFVGMVLGIFARFSTWWNHK